MDAGVFVPGNYLDESYRHDSSADLISGILHYALGDCNEAILHFENAQNELDSQSYKAEGAFFSLETLVGNCALLQGKYDLAIENLAHTVGLEGSADLYGSNLSTITNVTWAYIQIKDRDPFSLFNDYIHWIEIYKRDYPDYYDDYVYVDALIQRAQLYALAEHYDDAIADLTAAIELPTDDTPDLFILRGKMYLAQYEWDSALADYNHAIELDPTDADAYYERGVLYYSILQTGVELRADAYDDFHRYIELAPNGDHAADALRYAAQIEKELEALNG
ncbi:MAG: tetratricopeptide repeat protein [Chloroflexota bacterium]